MMGPIRDYLYRVFRSTEASNKEAILRLVEERLGGSLLDCGCGDGSFSVAVAARAKVGKIYGIETVEQRAEAAEGKGISVAHVDLNDGLPFDDQFFDIVHANQLLEHLHATDNFLREIKRVLKSSGYAILSTNNLASWHNVLSLALGMQPPPMHVSAEVIVGNVFDPLRGTRHDAAEDSHLRIFSFQALKELCQYHGFRVVDIRTAGYYPLPPVLARLFTFVDRRHGAFLITRLLPN